MVAAIRILADQTFGLGESPVWDDRRHVLFWVDIRASRLHMLNPDDSTHKNWDWPEVISCCGLSEAGQMLVGGRSGIWIFDPETAFRELIFPIGDLPADMRTNDGKVGPDGAFWISTMQDRDDRHAVGELLRIDMHGDVQKLLTGITTANGMEWSLDGRTFYLADTRELWVDRWDCDPVSGALTNRRRFITLEDGKPDGAAMDIQGAYWSAAIYSGKIHRYSDTGEYIQSVIVPAQMVTMPCFGGPNMKTMFITSLSRGENDCPANGGLYAVELDIEAPQPRRMAISQGAGVRD